MGGGGGLWDLEVQGRARLGAGSSSASASSALASKPRSSRPRSSRKAAHLSPILRSPPRHSLIAKISFPTREWKASREAPFCVPGHPPVGRLAGPPACLSTPGYLRVSPCSFGLAVCLTAGPPARHTARCCAREGLKWVQLRGGPPALHLRRSSARHERVVPATGVLVGGASGWEEATGPAQECARRAPPER